jgi:DNA-directed RNA polymerase subunit N (RpoN/RPB10)
MICELCQFDEYGQKNTAEVSFKDGYGQIYYVCEEHAEFLANENIKCLNCGSRKNENYDNEYDDMHWLIGWKIKCSDCGKDIGEYYAGTYDKYEKVED